MKRPAICESDRFVIMAWRKYPERFKNKPLSVTRYEVAYACRDFKMAIMAEWPFKLIFR